jgi:hypothetical protein
MAGVGYSQAVIARRINISEPTLRKVYREALDESVVDVCSRVFVNLVRAATTRTDQAGVNAARFILCCRAGWKETSRLEVEEQGRGITGMLALVAQAKESAEEAARIAAEDIAEQDAHRTVQ